MALYEKHQREVDHRRRKRLRGTPHHLPSKTPWAFGPADMHMSKLKQQLEAAGVRVIPRPFGFEVLGHGHRVLMTDLQALDRHDIEALTGTQRPALGRHGFRLGRDGLPRE